MINVRKNVIDFYHARQKYCYIKIYHAWQKYCAVKNWREAGRHVDWAYEEDGNTLWLYFQGSDERVDWLRDCIAIPTVLTPFFGRWVHCGFVSSLGDLFKDKAFLDCWMNTPHTNIVGYSSGGAIALLLGYLYRCMPGYGDLVQIYTFAAPRVAWARPLPPQPGTVNVRLSGDPIPHLPPRWLGWQDNPGETIVLPSRLGFKSHQPAAYSEALA